jgi:BMFP domain-containing protein YqiC
MNCTNSSQRLDELRDKIGALLPEDLRRLGEDAKRNARVLLESAYGRLNLVTRDDLELLRSSLLEARRTLEDIERRLAELESRATSPFLHVLRSRHRSETPTSDPRRASRDGSWARVPRRVRTPLGPRSLLRDAEVRDAEVRGDAAKAPSAPWPRPAQDSAGHGRASRCRRSRGSSIRHRP